MMETSPVALSTSHRSWYDRWYKILLVVPLVILAVCLVYLVMFYRIHGDVIYKDVSLSGGTTITLRGESVESSGLEQRLKASIPDAGVRTITELRTGRQLAVIVESSVAPEELQSAIEKTLGTQLAREEMTVEFTGPVLSSTFYRQLISALVFSFILISIVVFILFRTVIPSLTVIFAIFADIVMPLAVIDLSGIRLSAAGIAAFLMLIGYSVDTDILLTTRVLKKREGSVNERIYGAFKTGIFMNTTGLLAVIPAFFVVTGLPDSFRQIFLILGIGLFADVINTWLTNASMIKWYTEVKRIT